MQCHITKYDIASSSSSAVQDDIKELRKLERTTCRIRATLHDVEECWNIREEAAKLRLQELKEVACDAEDVVEEYEYVVNQHKLILRAREITDRYQEIVNYSDHLILSENDGEKRLIRDTINFQHTSSLIAKKTIVGRDHDKRRIVESIISMQEKIVRNLVCAIAIVGMGGLGKTTLAQLVYNNLRLRQLFDKHAWISVSENFDISSITRNIFSSLTNGRCEQIEFVELQERLANQIRDKRVLLVLDNVWNEKRPLGIVVELLPLPSLLLLSLEDCPNLSAVGDFLLLATLRVQMCSNLIAVSALPSLTALKIRDCSSIRAVTTLPSLTTFELRSCPNLSGVGTFPLLTSLKIEDCPQLNAVGSLPLLSTLEIVNPVKDEILHRLLNYHPSLECLKITYQTVTCISIVLHSLAKLRTLHLGDCPNLQNCDGFAGLCSLEKLEAWGCPKLPSTYLQPRQLNNMED
ncbi:hypothetical protein PR202_gb00132 [Eleusine coracana subsp. coracana]|uniref:NB-ARC domain-containing protein n=1 Tax=Eleusine coracana subsp. coracana TaxID=191504 RepID=A0AAV5DSN2_ELECO|nr:hypothetical protein PR202_gb00132 [Eleusine coracana subsp. coracana]